MCDPVSILLGVGSLLGSKKSTPAPPPLVPAKETRPDAIAEVVKNPGADVAIGGSGGGGESAAVKKLKRNLQRKNALLRPDAQVKTGAAGKATTNNKAKVGKARQREIELLEEAGLKVGSKGTGIQIL